MGLTNHENNHDSPVLDSWAAVVKENIDSTDGTIQVHVEKSMPKSVRKHVREVLNVIDELTGIEVKRVKNRAIADIVLHDEEETFGLDHPTANKLGGLSWAEPGEVHAAWKFDEVMRYNEHKLGKKGNPNPGYELTTWGRYVIAHEILHSFGLSHPDQDGYNPDFNTKDTLMSYNWKGGWKGSLGSIDTDALQDLWG